MTMTDPNVYWSTIQLNNKQTKYKLICKILQTKEWYIIKLSCSFNDISHIITKIFNHTSCSPVWDAQPYYAGQESGFKNGVSWLHKIFILCYWIQKCIKNFQNVEKNVAEI